LKRRSSWRIYHPKDFQGLLVVPDTYRQMLKQSAQLILLSQLKSAYIYAILPLVKILALLTNMPNNQAQGSVELSMQHHIAQILKIWPRYKILRVSIILLSAA
jgi:hypothetical protein